MKNIEKLSPDIIEKAKAVNADSGLVVMSVLYRGESFAALCKIEDLDAKYVSVKPVALVLSEEHLDHVTDVKGDHPESGLRKKLGI